MIEISGLNTQCVINAIKEFVRQDVKNTRGLWLTVNFYPLDIITNPEEISKYLSTENIAKEFTFAVVMIKVSQSFSMAVDNCKISVGPMLSDGYGHPLNPYWEDEGSPSSVRHFKELAISRHFVVRDNTAIKLRFENREEDMSETYASTWKDLMDGVCASRM